VFPGDGRPVFSDFLDDGITTRHGFGSISSSGVQMIGGTMPAQLVRSAHHSRACRDRNEPGSLLPGSKLLASNF
jgi:hypothetical protein